MRELYLLSSSVHMEESIPPDLMSLKAIQAGRPVDMCIGIKNLDTGVYSCSRYSSSPADDIRHAWDWPYYYGIYLKNLDNYLTVSYSGYYYWWPD